MKLLKFALVVLFSVIVAGCGSDLDKSLGNTQAEIDASFTDFSKNNSAEVVEALQVSMRALIGNDFGGELNIGPSNVGMIMMRDQTKAETYILDLCKGKTPRDLIKKASSAIDAEVMVLSDKKAKYANDENKLKGLRASETGFAWTDDFIKKPKISFTITNGTENTFSQVEFYVALQSENGTPLAESVESWDFTDNGGLAPNKVFDLWKVMPHVQWGGPARQATNPILTVSIQNAKDMDGNPVAEVFTVKDKNYLADLQSINQKLKAYL